MTPHPPPPHPHPERVRGQERKVTTEASGLAGWI